MILELDAGNTRIKWRLRDDSGKVARGHLASSLRWSELSSALEAAMANLDGKPVGRVLVASVLGDVRNQELQAWCERQFAITPEFALGAFNIGGVFNGYTIPESLGVDRWLAILAGFALVRQACVIVDGGSALTVDLLHSSGHHIGGYIAPGIKLMRRALLGNTHGVHINELPADFSLTPGRDTETCVAAAQAAMVCGLIEQALSQLRQVDQREPALIFTGGDAEWLLSHFPDAYWQPDLVLDGLSQALPAQ